MIQPNPLTKTVSTPRPLLRNNIRAALRRERLAWRMLMLTLIVLLGMLAALQMELSWTQGQYRLLSSTSSTTLDRAIIAPQITSTTAEPPVESEQKLLEVNTLPETPPPAPALPPLAQSFKLDPIEVPELNLPAPPPTSRDELAIVEDDFAPETSLVQEPRKSTASQARSKTQPAPRQQQSRRLAQQAKPQKKAAKSSSSSGIVSKTLPRYRSAPKPPYPRSLRARQVEGSVRVRIAVSAKGKPTQVSILATSGYREFDSTARSWIISRWSFVPATQNGRAIASSVTTRIHFTLHS